MRKTALFNDGWTFVKSAENSAQAAAAQGVPVVLPHTWNAEDGQDGGNDYYRGTCWYVRHLSRDELIGLFGVEKEIWIEFEGAAMTSDVYLNGEHLFHHEGGYSTFRVNFTGHLKQDNMIAVSVDNSSNDRVYPQKADFTFYGGIYRNVKLIAVPEAHFALGYEGAPGIRVTPDVKPEEESGGRLPEGKAKVTVEAWTEGTDGKEEYLVKFMLDGQTETVPVRNGYAQAEFELAHARLWNGLDDPYLYRAEAGLYKKADKDAEPLDEISARFGCRQLQFDPQKGFILNGRVYPLRGVSRHQDRSGVGNALTEEMHREDLAIIREMGANTIRLAHYQHAQYFYDLCDEAGMVVWAEIPYITMHMKNGRENTLSQMRELILQNYNHPCIVCWGLSNEITAAGGVTEDLLENHRQLNDLCHRLDGTRPTTMAHVFMLETDSELIRIADIGSYNLYFGWYLGELTQNEEFFDEYHEKYPDRCIGFSEYGADANPAFQSSDPKRGDYTETYQTVYHEHILDMIEQRPFLWATHVWNMFDFAADGRDEGGKHGQNQKGLVTMDRKTRKDAFYLYKAHWSSDPFVHICGRRYVDRAEDVTEVKVYSNRQEITLYVDGKEFGTKTGKHRFIFQVPITGEHRITAVSGDLRDETVIRRTDRPNPDYQYIQQGGVVNWFDRDDFNPEYYSIMDKFGELTANPDTAVLIQKIMEQAVASRGEVAQSVNDNPNLQRMMSRMTMESILNQAGDAVSREQIKELNAALQKIQKPEADAKCR